MPPRRMRTWRAARIPVRSFSNSPKRVIHDRRPGGLQRLLAVRPEDPPPPPPKEAPPEIDQWNWGAFLMPALWAIRNRAWIALWCAVPVVGQVFMFYVGARGSRWAWQSGNWKSLDHFKRVQKRWAIAGIIVYIVTLAASGWIVKAMVDVNQSTARAAAFELVGKNEEAVHALGAPVKLSGLAHGSVVKVQGQESEAHIVFGVEGARRKGTVTTNGKKAGGKWVFDKISVAVERREEPIELV